MERIARESVTFAQPFFLEGFGREQPAGTYEVELVEELIEGLSFLAFRVVSASVVLPLASGVYSYQLARIEPSLVRAAIHAGEKKAAAGKHEGTADTRGAE